MSGALIEAGLWLIAPGEWRYDAAIRVDNGRVVQIGTWEAVSYGVDHLPRFRAPDALALPLSGRLRPGERADFALLPAQGALTAENGLMLFEGGEARTAAHSAALQAWLIAPETSQLRQQAARFLRERA